MGKVIQFPVKQAETPSSTEFGDRVSRIRDSLKKINKLMNDLKKMTQDKGN